MTREIHSDAIERLEKLGFVYRGEVITADGLLLEGRQDTNLIPTVGLAHIAGTALLGTTALVPNWYMGLMVSNVVPDKGFKATDLPNLEGTSYSGATRPEWVKVFDGNVSVDNFDANAQFVFPASLTADTRIYGAFLVSNNQKGGSAGTLLSIARFSSPYIVPAGSTFKLAIGIALATS